MCHMPTGGGQGGSHPYLVPIRETGLV
jgi:hypothetical protein